MELHNSEKNEILPVTEDVNKAHQLYENIEQDLEASTLTIVIEEMTDSGKFTAPICSFLLAALAHTYCERCVIGLSIIPLP